MPKMLASPALAGLLLAAPAMATAEPCLSSLRTRLVLPVPGANEVPTNTRIWFGLMSSNLLHEDVNALQTPDVHLVGPDGSEVTMSLNYLWTPYRDAAVIATPARLLEPETSYRVLSRDRELTTFRTGSGEDHTPPDRPDVTAVEPREPYPDPLCGSDPSFAFHVNHSGDLLVAAQSGPLVQPELEGFVTELATGEEMTLFVGGHRLAPQGYPAGTPAAVVFLAVDLAGNLSDAQLVILPMPAADAAELQPGSERDAGETGCSSTAGATTAAGTIVAAALLAVQRRRASR